MKYLISMLVSLFLYVGSLPADQKRVFIPAGEFTMGCSNNDSLCDPDEGPNGGVKVFVKAFWINRHETSVEEYRACVMIGNCEYPFDNKRNYYCNYDAPGRNDYPVNCINWMNAQAFCNWQQGRLAYEAEWEKAARAGTNTPYPWGSKPANCNLAIMDPGKTGESDNMTDGCWRDLSWPRGSHKPNSLGLFDMVGGTSEWVMNWYDINGITKYYNNGNITGPASGSKKVIKGGSWDEKHWAQRVSNRYAKPVTGNPDLYGSNGIRCVFPEKPKLK